MTSGTTTWGVRDGGPYFYRNWAGNDGNHGEEHNFAYNVRESYFPPIEYAFVFFPNWWTKGSMLTFAPALPQSYVDHTVNLINCATNKVQDDLLQSKFNAGVFAGEFRETYHMMCAIVSSVARAIAYGKRGRWDEAMNVLSTQGKANPQLGTAVAANNYMMWHFGILPLLSDLRAAYEYLIHNYRVVKRVRRHCRYKDSAVVSLSGVSWQWELNALVEIRGEVSSVQINDMDRLGLYDLASVAWEVTKLSWLVDWLLPIGNFLSAVNAARQTQGASFAITRMQKETLTSPKSAGYPYIFRGFIDTSYDKIYSPGPLNSRSLLTELPWHFPSIENPLGDNLSRWVTATAFLRQTVGR